MCAPGANSPGAGPRPGRTTLVPDATVPAGSCAPLALYGPRFVGLSVSVLARGRVSPGASQLHHQSQERDRRALPLWVPLPTAGETGQEILLGSPWRPRASFAVPRLWVAPKDELLPEWEFRYWMQHTAPQAISLTLAVLAMFALLMWMQHRAETSPYLLFSLAAFGWVARNLHHYIDPPTQATLRAWYWWDDRCLASAGCSSWPCSYSLLLPRPAPRP